MSFVATLPETMQAAMIYAPGDVRYETVATPTPGHGEMVVSVDTALTCGTDLKTYRRGHPVLIKQYPSGFGHECAGTVVALGEGVTQFSVGDRVVAANSAPCEVCFYCQKNQPNLCESLDLLNGAYAQYLRIPARIVAKNTLLIPPHVSFSQAAFTEPLSVCVRAIEGSRIMPGDRVAILGVGAIGLMLCKLAKLAGAHVTGFGRQNPLKKALALEFAAVDAFADLTAYATPEQICQDLTPDGRGFDVVIEAIGQPETWELAVALTRKGGLAHLFGGCERGTSVNFDTRRLHYDEITIISLFHHTPKHFREALELIATHQVDPTVLVTENRSVSDVVSALEAVAQGQAIKVALTP